MAAPSPLPSPGRLIRAVSSFYAKVLDSPRLAVYFEGSSIEALVKHQTAFMLSIGSEWPAYSDDDLQAVHQPLRITDDYFTELISTLKTALADTSLEQTVLETIVEGFEARRGLIVHR